MTALSELKFLKPDQIKTDPESLKFYGKDWTTYFDINALAIVFPHSIVDVQNLVRWARKRKVGLIPSGGRTGLSGAAVATNGEVVVSFEQMNQILDFNEIDQIVTLQAGVITESLQQYAKNRGFFYPVDFASRGSSQIGGNIATNAGGIKVIRYGMTRDWVVGLKVVTGAGELLELSRALVKDATGFDLRHLFIGSEGTLGFIVEAQIKLAPAPPPHQVLIMGACGLDSVMNIFSLFKKNCALVAFEMFSEKALSKVVEKTSLPRPFQTRTDYYVLIEIEIRSNSDENRLLEIFESCVEKGWAADGTMSQSEQQSKNFWRLREDIAESFAEYSPYKNDVSVKISQVPMFMQDLDGILKTAYPLWDVIWFGHVGDGNLHISILRPYDLDKKAFVAECRKVDQLIFAAVKKYGGSISAEHGVGLTKKPFLAFTRSAVEIQLMKSIKKILDPDNIMNPGKVFDI